MHGEGRRRAMLVNTTTDVEKIMLRQTRKLTIQLSPVYLHYFRENATEIQNRMSSIYVLIIFHIGYWGKYDKIEIMKLK